MILSVAIYLFVYIVGGLTLLPGILIFCWYFYFERQAESRINMGYPPQSQPTSPLNDDDAATTKDRYGSKQGWIRLMTVREQQPLPGKKAEFENDASSGGKNGRRSCFSSSLSYGLLRHGTLFCFDNDQQKTCHLMLPIRNYTVSLYPKNGKAEAELFGRLMSICLTPRKNNNNNNNTATIYYYITCRRPIDKEDWYFSLTSASYYLLDDNNNNNNNSNGGRKTATTTLFDPWAMTALRGVLDGDAAQVDAQCWNAMMGRLFLGVYKTETWRQMWHTKMKNKLDKINNFHQHPLQQLVGEHHHLSGGDTDGYGKKNGVGKRSLMRLLPLQLQLISMGDTIPCLTNAKLMEFTTDGTCIIHAQLDYDGDFLVVLRTGLDTLWRPPSSLMSPFGKKKKKPASNGDGDDGGGGASTSSSSSLPLVLSLKLRHCSGKVVFKIKPPPTCRVWAAFDTMPIMEWQVTPVVLDKQIKWSYVIHLLQTKIRDLVAESLVMPNMEDFPFYDSGGLGGIFGNGGRDDDDLCSTTTNNNDKDSAIDVDLANEKDDKQQQHQTPPPMVSTLVQGYMDRIRNPHKYPSSPLSNMDTTTQ